MKDLKKFLSEAREGVPSKDDIEKLQRMARPETSTSSAKKISRSLSSQVERRGRKTRTVPSALTQGQIASAWKSGSEGKPSVMATSNKPEKGTWFGSSKDVIQKGREAESELRQQVRDTLLKNKGGSAELQAAQSSGPEETMVGKGAKSGTGEKYRANRPSDTRATGVVSKPKKPPVVKQSEVSQQARSYRTAQGEKRYQAAKLDQDVRREFPTGKGGLKADERNPYVKRGVRQARADNLGGNVWKQPSRRSKRQSTRTFLKNLYTGRAPVPGKSPLRPDLPDLEWEPTTPSKSKPTAGAPQRTSLKKAISDIRASDVKLARGSSGYNLGGLPLDRSVPKAPPKIERPKIGSGTASGYTIDNSPQPGSEVVKYTGAKAQGSAPINKGSALARTMGDGIPDAMKKGALDAARRQRNVKRSLDSARAAFTGKEGSITGREGQSFSYRPISSAEKSAEAARKQTAAMHDDLKAQQKAQQKAQRRSQARVRLKGMKRASMTRGAGGLLGLGIAGYDAYQTYKHAKAQGASDTRAALRGITKAAGGALAGGLAAAGATALGGPLAGMAAGGAAYSFGADAAEKAFRAAADPLADMARKNRLVKKGTSTIEKLGRNIPFLKGYYDRKDKAKATGSK